MIISSHSTPFLQVVSLDDYHDGRIQTIEVVEERQQYSRIALRISRKNESQRGSEHIAHLVLRNQLKHGRSERIRAKATIVHIAIHRTTI
jgi:hypothetical protein